VDDDDEFRDAATKWFAGRGHAVSAAASGEEALALAELTDLDVAIFDLRMPGLSGLDLLRRFKEAGCEAEILMLTGEGTVETAVEALKLGAYDYVSNPASWASSSAAAAPPARPRDYVGRTATYGHSSPVIVARQRFSATRRRSGKCSG
jgi:DNA-binding NtrC family response regulator